MPVRPTLPQSMGTIRLPPRLAAEKVCPKQVHFNAHNRRSANGKTSLKQRMKRLRDVCNVAPTVRLSNLFLDDLRKLFELEPILPVQFLTSSAEIIR